MGIWGWWAFDIFTLMASYLSITAVGAQTILRSLGLLTFMIPVGFSAASGILIGQNVGKGKADLITHYFKWCNYLAVSISFVTIFLCVMFRDQIFGIFTT